MSSPSGFALSRVLAQPLMQILDAGAAMETQPAGRMIYRTVMQATGQDARTRLRGCLRRWAEAKANRANAPLIDTSWEERVPAPGVTIWREAEEAWAGSTASAVEIVEQPDNDTRVVVKVLAGGEEEDAAIEVSVRLMAGRNAPGHRIATAAPRFVADYALGDELDVVWDGCGPVLASMGLDRLDELAATLTDPDRLAPVFVISGHHTSDRELVEARHVAIARRFAGTAHVRRLEPGIADPDLGLQERRPVHGGWIHVFRSVWDPHGDVGDGPAAVTVPCFALGDQSPNEVAARLARFVPMDIGSDRPPECLGVSELLVLRARASLGADLSQAEVLKDAGGAIGRLEDDLAEALDEARSDRREREEAEFQLEAVSDEKQALLFRNQALEAAIRDAIRDKRPPRFDDISPAATGETEFARVRASFIDCRSVVEHYRANSRLEIGPDCDDGITKLDDTGQSKYVSRLAEALQMLAAFVDWRNSGGSGNVADFCATGRAGWSADNVALKESKSTESDEKCVAERRFRAPGLGAGTVYMNAHLKIGGNRPPAPRIHFWDDTGGTSGTIHVGWIGPHRKTVNTN